MDDLELMTKNLKTKIGCKGIKKFNFYPNFLKYLDSKLHKIVDFLKEIKKKIRSMNIDYKFETLDGQIKDDVLLAYV